MGFAHSMKLRRASAAVPVNPLTFNRSFWNDKISQSRPIGCQRVKVAWNEVKNASFAQRSAHREGKNMATGIDRTGRGAQATRADDDGRSNRPTPTHRFCYSAIFHPITPYNVWFFWVSRHGSIILAKKMETFSSRFWEIPGNVRKLELSKTLVDHKNALVFYQAVSGKSSWSFSYRWTQY